MFLSIFNIYIKNNLISFFPIMFLFIFSFMFIVAIMANRFILLSRGGPAIVVRMGSGTGGGGITTRRSGSMLSRGGPLIVVRIGIGVISCFILCRSGTG